jgi:hypothetical protein
VAFDLKEFFAVVGKDPVEVTAVDVFEFVAHQRGIARGAAGGPGVGVVDADDRPAAVIGVRPVCVPDRPRVVPVAGWSPYRRRGSGADARGGHGTGRHWR